MSPLGYIADIRVYSLATVCSGQNRLVEASFSGHQKYMTVGQASASQSSDPGPQRGITRWLKKHLNHWDCLTSLGTALSAIHQDMLKCRAVIFTWLAD